MLWHIMNVYSSNGFNEFVCALGYKGEAIKEYFLNYYALNSDITVDLGSGSIDYILPREKKWKVNLIDTGANTLTGGRLKRLQSFLSEEQTFMLTYGDGIANVDINKLVAFHKSHGKLATVTSVRPPARFGNIQFEGDMIRDFKEKPQTGEGWINGGFFVFDRKIFDFLGGDETILEREPLERLAAAGQLIGFRHEGFWQCMDTLRDKQFLEDLWNQPSGAPWKTW